MYTKLDRLRDSQQEAAKREANIAMLQGRIAEAREVYNAIPYGGYEEQQERQFVQKRITRLQELADDEQRAIDALRQATDAETEAAISKMEAMTDTTTKRPKADGAATIEANAERAVQMIEEATANE